jgi:hypothetical protein
MKIIIPTIVFALIILFGCEKLQEDEIQLKIHGEVPTHMNLGDLDTLTFSIVSHTFYIQLIEFREVVNINDTVTWARFTQQGQIGNRILEKEVRLVYNPNTPGVKNLHLLAKCGNIYTYYYPFKIIVNN